MFKTKTKDFAAETEKLSRSIAGDAPSPLFNSTPTTVSESKRGVILSFKQADGYGFVRGDDGEKYFFRVESVKETGLSKVGKHVIFTVMATPRQLGKAPKIENLMFDQERDDAEDPNGKNSSRVKCPKCGKWMAPRVVFRYGEPLHSICPFCFEVFKKNEEMYDLLERRAKTAKDINDTFAYTFVAIIAAFSFAGIYYLYLYIWPYISKAMGL